MFPPISLLDVVSWAWPGGGDVRFQSPALLAALRGGACDTGPSRTVSKRGHWEPPNRRRRQADMVVRDLSAQRLSRFTVRERLVVLVKIELVYRSRIGSVKSR